MTRPQQVLWILDSPFYAHRLWRALARGFTESGWRVKRRQSLPLSTNPEAALRRAWSIQPPDLLLVWNGLKGRRAIVSRVATELGVPRLYFERAPLPGFVQADPRGVNAASFLAQQWSGSWKRQLDRQALAGQLVARRPKRGRQVAGSARPPRYYFAPLQVASDTQLSHHGGWVKSMAQFLDILADLHSDIPIVVKPHPSDKTRQALAGQAERLGLTVAADDANPYELARNAEAVITVNSSLGLETLVFDRPLLVLGEAFYARSGLVQPVASSEQLAAGLSALALVTPELRSQYLAFLQDAVFLPLDAAAPRVDAALVAELVRRASLSVDPLDR